MSGPYALRELARADLEAIWVYTVEQLGIELAKRYLQGLFDCFDELAADSRLGRERDDVKAGYRSFPQGRHVVFYLIASTGIGVIGIVHQSADVTNHLGSPLHDNRVNPRNRSWLLRVISKALIIRRCLPAIRFTSG